MMPSVWPSLLAMWRQLWTIVTSCRFMTTLLIWDCLCTLTLALEVLLSWNQRQDVFSRLAVLNHLHIFALLLWCSKRQSCFQINYGTCICIAFCFSFSWGCSDPWDLPEVHLQRNGFKMLWGQHSCSRNHCPWFWPKLRPLSKLHQINVISICLAFDGPDMNAEYVDILTKWDSALRLLQIVSFKTWSFKTPKRVSWDLKRSQPYLISPSFFR